LGGLPLAGQNTLEVIFMNQKRMIWVFGVLLFLSLWGNACLLLSHLNLATGGGRDESSPDSVYWALAMGKRQENPLSPDKGKNWGDLSIYTKPVNDDRDPIIRLIVTPPGTDSEFAYFRETEELIRWSKDSKTVTFRLPNATISVTPQKTK